MAKKAEVKHEAKPGADQPGFDKSRRTDEGDIDQLDANGMGLPVEEPPVSAREGTSGVNVNRIGPRA